MTKLIRTAVLSLTCVISAATWVSVSAQDIPQRKELKRVDLSGAPGMEVISSIVEYKPGEQLVAHTHHGIEMGYVLQGAMVQAPGKEAVMFPTGASFMYLRDVPHSGVRVVGDQSLKMFAVHTVDKGKPLYESVK
jgi:quercetin dioxygenase-like cupin family protein